MKILLGFTCFGPYYWYEDPIYSLFGFILMIVIVILAIKEKIRKKKQVDKTVLDNEIPISYVEKDVLGFDKTYINYSEPSYKPADKSKFKFIVFIALFIIGLFFVVIYSPIRYGPYKGSTTGTGHIHHPEDRSLNNFYGPFYWNYYYEEPNEKNKLDTSFVFKPKNIFENKVIEEK